MVILRKGVKIYSGRVDEMVASQGFFEVKADKEAELIAFLEKHEAFGTVTKEGEIIKAFLAKPLNAADFNKAMFDQGIVLSHLVNRKESLEEQFLMLTENQSN